MSATDSQASACVLDQLNAWFKTIQPTPTYHDTHMLFSRLVEEHTDLLVLLQEAGTTTHARDEIGFSVSVLDFLKRRFAAAPGGIEVDIPSLDRAAVLKALCQQLTTLVAIANVLEMNLPGAMKSLAASNQSMLDEESKPTFNLQGRVVPPSRLTAPHYSSYI